MGLWGPLSSVREGLGPVPGNSHQGGGWGAAGAVLGRGSYVGAVATWPGVICPPSWGGRTLGLQWLLKSGRQADLAAEGGVGGWTAPAGATVTCFAPCMRPAGLGSLWFSQEWVWETLVSSCCLVTHSNPSWAQGCGQRYRVLSPLRRGQAVTVGDEACRPWATIWRL